MSATLAARLRTAVRVSGWCVLLPLLAALVSGGVLCWYYVPTSALAHASLVDMQAVAPLGGVARALHNLSSQLALGLGLLHFVLALLRGAAAATIARRWRSGLLALGLLAGVAFAGRVLPWDEHAATSLTMAATLLAGDAGVATASGADARTLQRVLLLHVGAVLLLGALLVAHGLASALRGPLAERRALLVALLLGALLLAASVLRGAPALGLPQPAGASAEVGGAAQWFLRWLQQAALCGASCARLVTLGLLLLALGTPLLARRVSPLAARAAWSVVLIGAALASALPC